MIKTDVTGLRRLTICDLPEDMREAQCWTRYPKIKEYIRWYETEFSFAPFDNPVDYVLSQFEIVDEDK